MSITDFLLARFAEDEDRAKRAAFGWGSTWSVELDSAEGWAVVHADGKRYMVGSEDDDVALHIARHDPTRVLRECEAKRRIVDEHTFMAAHESRDFGFSNGNCLTCRVQGPCATVLHLASVYADHPDYRDEWRTPGEDDSALVALAEARLATDDGVRHDLDDVAREFGTD